MNSAAEPLCSSKHCSIEQSVHCPVFDGGRMLCRSVIWRVGVFAGFPLLLSGCGVLACEEMGCMGTFTVELADTNRSAEAVYVLTVALDGQESACTWGPEGADDETGCIVSEADAGLHLQFWTGMGSATEVVPLTLEEDGIVVIEVSASPDWSEPFYPNGERCDQGMGCQSALVALDF